MRHRDPAFTICPEHCDTGIRPGTQRAINAAFHAWQQRRGFTTRRWSTLLPKKVDGSAEHPGHMAMHISRRSALMAKLSAVSIGGRKEFTARDLAEHYKDLRSARATLSAATRNGLVRITRPGVPGRNSVPALFSYQPPR